MSVDSDRTDTNIMDATMLDQLFYSSDSDGGEIQQVRVEDQGSSPRCALVQVQGVPVSGVIDTGADITIINGDLLKRVAALSKLKKKNFKPSDKHPKTYDQKPFTLHGRIELDISFEGTTMNTPVYLKLDAYEPLLLSEGVCQQLGMIVYHPKVQVGRTPTLPTTSKTEKRGHLSRGCSRTNEDSQCPTSRENREVREVANKDSADGEVVVTTTQIPSQNIPQISKNNSEDINLGVQLGQDDEELPLVLTTGIPRPKPLLNLKGNKNDLLAVARVEQAESTVAAEETKMPLEVGELEQTMNRTPICQEIECVVPTIYVRLLQSVHVLPHESKTVPIQLEGKCLCCWSTSQRLKMPMDYK